VNVIQDRVPAEAAVIAVRTHQVVEVFDQTLVVHARLGKSE
jgi:hypothetical protein